LQLFDDENLQRIAPCQPIRTTGQQHVKAVAPRQIAHPTQAGVIQPQSAISFISKLFDDFHATVGGMVPQGLKLGDDRMLRLLCRAGNPRIDGGSNCSHFLSPPG
jgi:ribosomal protein L13